MEPAPGWDPSNVSTLSRSLSLLHLPSDLSPFESPPPRAVPTAPRVPPRSRRKKDGLEAGTDFQPEECPGRVASASLLRSKAGRDVSSHAAAVDARGGGSFRCRQKVPRRPTRCGRPVGRSAAARAPPGGVLPGAQELLHREAL